jgi:hypothetical protein
MKIIAHRRNTIAQLVETPKKYGIEVDIRSFDNELHIHHDPFIQGEFFSQWLSKYEHGTLILNVKEEGLEERLIALMKEFGINDYFFLDQSFPFLIKYSSLAENRSAVRISEYESIETAYRVAGRVTWAWLDCFNHFPVSEEEVIRLKELGLKLCIVSPELQGRPAEIEIPQYIQRIQPFHSMIDAVCTKRYDLWEQSGMIQ